MTKITLLLSGLLLFIFASFVFANFSFAQGKITPFDWDKPVNPEELGEPLQLQSTQPDEPVADYVTISGMVGNLKILRPDGTWEDVSSGQVLKEGDTIRTDEKSSATGKFSSAGGSGGEITIGPNSEFKFNLRGVESQRQYLMYGYIELSFGFIRIKGWIKGGKIRTPYVAVAVRGTDVIVFYNPNTAMTDIYLYEGLVDVDNLHGKIISLQPGETVSVDGGGEMVLGKLDREKWEQLTDEISPTGTPERTDQSDAATQETGEKPLNKKLLWFGLAGVLLGIIGAGVFIYRKKS